jgi:transaldolase / glucose-6-phosphate isomerase
MEEVMNPLRALAEKGQSVWLDNLSREIITNGELARLIKDDGLAGITSNPTIFEKAIGESAAYDTDIARLAGKGDVSLSAIYERIATADIAAAADLLRPLYDKTESRHGYVSLEVSPYLAMDTAATIEEARRLWAAVGRDNIFIKVPATAAGIPAVRRLLAEGINVNITLLFAQQVYEEVVEAFFAGLEDRVAAKQPIARIASVASFFVSRIDTAVDKLLDQAMQQSSNAERAALEKLRGKVAVANAKLAYQRWQKRFSGARWERLQQLGARPQQLLWASTGTKNPAYSDVLYVEELIGPETVNTMPEKTMDAFRDHGRVRDTLTADVGAAGQTLAALDGAGISLEGVTTELVADGVRLFAEAFDKLNAALAGKRKRALGKALNEQTVTLPEPLLTQVAKAAKTWRAEGNIRRLWNEDATLWTGGDVGDWLGWLDVIDAQLRDLPRFAEFAGEVRAQGYSDVLLLGMGGSSLGPEVLALSLGSAPGFPKLHVLDSTDPQQVMRFEKAIDIARTLFIVSSKSGTTLEPNVLMDYFFAKAADALGGAAGAGRHFVAVTDPGSKLEKIAAEKHFHRVFHGIPSIGGRYSVLSPFGLVPLAAIGHDVRAFLDIARTMARSCGPEVPPPENPGVELGLTIGVAALAGRDKVTVIASPSIASFGAWAEQLLAESTGKHGKGVIPIAGEALGDPSVYDAHRLFISMRDAAHEDAAQDQAIDALERAGHPVVRISMASAEMLAQEFFRFEIATAVAGAVIGIDAFDQPDVEASKIATRELTDAYEKSGSLGSETPVFKQNGVALYTDERNARALRQAGANSTLESWLGAHFGRIHDGDYFALLAYVDRSEAHIRSLQDMRTAVRDSKHVATCLQFGPRFLHSTGQAYKGGPNSGVFLQVTAQSVPDLAIPGRKASFGVIEAAQARGDLRVLAERGRRVLRAHVHDVDSGLAAIGNAARAALR